MIINTVEKAVTKLPQIQLDSEFSPRDILHMILAGGTSQTLFHLDRGIHQRAVNFLCRETSLSPDYVLDGGIVQEDDRGRPCFKKGTSRFPANEHWNEFLGTLALAGAHFPMTEVRTDRGNSATLADLADTAMAECSENDEDPGWSLMLFSVHPGVTEDWKNDAGERWSVERLLERALLFPHGAGTCFGTHLLQGVSFAVSRYCLDQDIEPFRMNGVWSRAWSYIQDALFLMRKNQQEDGSMIRCWFRNRKLPAGVTESIEFMKEIWSRQTDPACHLVNVSGHCLSAVSPIFDFLDSDLDWLERCCYVLAQTVDLEWTKISRDIHSLAHAVHALKQIGM